jgi:serine/threonine-protein kinase RsbW
MAPQNKQQRGDIRLTVLGILEHRDVVLRAVSAACKLVTPQPQGPEWNDFQHQVVSAVSEAFNNLVLHAYHGKRKGPVDLLIQTAPGRIQIQLRDWGRSFNPKSVPAPELDALPESGLGLYIMRSFMGVTYRRGRPNLLTLRKKLLAPSASQAPAATPAAGQG